MAERVIHFFKEDKNAPLPYRYHIVASFVTGEDGGTFLRLEGRDEDIARDDRQVLADMEEVAERVRRCCALRAEVEGEPAGAR